MLTARPSVLLLDEPTTGQDRRHVELLMDTLAGHTSVHSLVYCTHDVENALRHATRILVMSQGSIIADGSPQEVLRNREILARGGLVLPPLRLLALQLGIGLFDFDVIFE